MPPQSLSLEQSPEPVAGYQPPVPSDYPGLPFVSHLRRPVPPSSPAARAAGPDDQDLAARKGHFWERRHGLIAAVALAGIALHLTLRFAFPAAAAGPASRCWPF